MGLVAFLAVAFVAIGVIRIAWGRWRGTLRWIDELLYLIWGSLVLTMGSVGSMPPSLLKNQLMGLVLMAMGSTAIVFRRPWARASERFNEALRMWRYDARMRLANEWLFVIVGALFIAAGLASYWGLATWR